MQERRRRRERQGSPARSISRRVAPGRHRLLCRFYSAMHIGIASWSVCKLEALALVTTVSVCTDRSTKEGESRVSDQAIH